jgi:hypothetical protein
MVVPLVKTQRQRQQRMQRQVQTLTQTQQQVQMTRQKQTRQQHRRRQAQMHRHQQQPQTRRQQQQDQVHLQQQQQRMPLCLTSGCTTVEPSTCKLQGVCGHMAGTGHEGVCMPGSPAFSCAGTLLHLSYGYSRRVSRRHPVECS